MKNSPIKLLLTLAFVLLLFCEVFGEGLVKKRVRRHLRFLDKTVIFVRLNTKENIISETRIYAQAIGFRANYQPPHRRIFKFPLHKVERRDVYEHMEEMLMKHGFDGRACVLKTLCEASKMATPQSNILLKLYKKIFTIPEGDDRYFPYLKSEECEVLEEHCPLSLMEVSKYTDE